MFKRKAGFFVLSAVIFISLFGCSPSNKQKDIKNMPVENKGFPMTIVDSYNRKVTIEKEPQRVISAAPNITEIIFALNKSAKLVGRTEYCDYPEDVKNIASIGAIDSPSIEKIVELKPDLVVGSSIIKTEAVKKLEELGIKVAIFVGEESFNGAYNTIENVGKVLNASDNAQKIVSEMKTKVQTVQDKVKGRSKPSVYYVVSYGKAGDFTAGKDTFIGQMIEMAGGKNAADDVNGWSYSLEKLTEKNPDIMICPMYFNTKSGIESTAGYKELKAVKNGKLFEIDNNRLDRQGPRLADGLTELSDIIQP